MDKENLCRRCGRCCYEKLVLDNVVVITEIPCRFFDNKHKACRVYAERHGRHARCLTVAEALAKNALPADCPYASGIKGYAGAVSLKEYAQSAEELAGLRRLADKHFRKGRDHG